ncbi:MAG: hypothetical protein Fur0037_16240 [Planctomycetota bacterium]
MNFRRWVVFTFLIHALVVIVDKGGGLVLYLLTANHPAQHGMSGIVASLPFILGAVANLGLATSQVFFIRRGRFTAQQCFETSMTVALLWGGSVAAAAAAATLWVLPLLNPDWTFDPWIVIPFCAVVPVLLVCSYSNSIQLATERVKDYGLVHLAGSLGFLPAFFLCFFAFGGDVGKDVPYGVAWGRLLSTLIVTALALALVRRAVRLRLGIHRGFLREGIHYGWKANLTSTLNYLNHRLDLVVLGALYVVPAGGDQSRLSQVAFYSMAVTWAELVWHFPEAMRDLFFSKVAGSTHEQAKELTPVLARLSLLVSVVGAVMVLLLIDPVMSLITSAAKGSDEVWRRDWYPTVFAALLALSPGTVAYTISKVLQADLGARDRLQTCVNAQVLVLVSMLALDILWIPGRGAVGAALASTVAYALSTVYSLFAYCGETKTPFWRCLVVHVSDLAYIREILDAVIAKLLRREV